MQNSIAEELVWDFIAISLESDTENAMQCESKVIELFKKNSVEVPEEMLERANRIGKQRKNKNSDVMEQTMIVKFPSWKYTTAEDKR